MQQVAAQKLAGLAAEVEQSKITLAQAQAALKETQSQVRELEARLADTQEQRVALEEMYRELSRSADDRMLAEVEQLLIIASQQLQLAGNVKGALIALQAADQRLARADKLQVAQLRRTLNLDMERLKALPQVDTVGIAVKLDNLVAQADTLPLLVSDSLPRRARGARQAARGAGMVPRRPRLLGGNEVARAHPRPRVRRRCVAHSRAKLFPAREPQAAPARGARGAACARRAKLP